MRKRNGTKTESSGASGDELAWLELVILSVAWVGLEI